MAKYYQRSVAIFALLALISGCSSIEKSTGAGAGAGALVGGIAGSMMPGSSAAQPQSIIVGALAGGAVGALSGALIHKAMEDHERDAFEKGKQAGSKNAQGGATVASTRGSNSARYIPARVERRRVSEEVRGNTLVEEHYEQVIVEDGHWE